MRREIMFAGFGGQGVVTAGYITGQAAAVYDDRECSFTRVYGPEARGSACYSGVVVDEEEIDYPYLLNPEIMVIMSQEAYEKFLSKLADGGLLIIDSSIVRLDERAEKYKRYNVPATQIAEKMGARVVANVVMLGFVGRIWRGVSVDGLRESVKATVPTRHLDLNLRAFERGIELAEKAIESAPA
ncbi:MAG: 2-oxoacid:acceptor oxidoreductase family protein [Candidatus Bathyarchaeota archaeon]|nr:MAG: 2-oxoacid:acceptor oxidoreductase family protein [Candidatus Bathyarchaeota archaeon]UCD39560.1 MAG: 2-oxoacid:acceptor oxidoreductase family protein [Candidatus Bathyarchaeota archaeon]